ncbi:MAG: hypothetical protein WC495_05900 [Patescibacteria group bacterium]|jgi:hypothetical protein
MKNKLAPCPKCGGEVSIEIEDADYPCYEYVVCKKCGFQKMYHFGNGMFRWNKEFEDK